MHTTSRLLISVLDPYSGLQEPAFFWRLCPPGLRGTVPAHPLGLPPPKGMLQHSDYAHIPVNYTAYEHDGMLAWDLPGHMLINSINRSMTF